MKLIVAISLLAFSAFGGYKYADNQWRADWALRDATEATARADAVDIAVATHKKRIAELEKANNETKQRLTDEILAKRAADDAADGLRQSLENYVQRSRNNTGTTTAERAAAATNITVLAQLLGRFDRTAEDFAKVAGERYIAGLDCQQRYKIMSGG